MDLARSKARQQGSKGHGYGELSHQRAKNFWPGVPNHARLCSSDYTAHNTAHIHQGATTHQPYGCVLWTAVLDALIRDVKRHCVDCVFAIVTMANTGAVFSLSRAAYASF